MGLRPRHKMTAVLINILVFNFVVSGGCGDESTVSTAHHTDIRLHTHQVTQDFWEKQMFF